MSDDQPSYCNICGKEIRRGKTYVLRGGEKYHPRCLPKALNHEEQA